MSDLFDYKKEMSQLRFTDEQKKTLAEAAASAAGRTAKRRRPVFRTALIAAAMVMVLAAGASAAGILPSPTEIFAPLFGGSVAQTEVIDKIGRPIGASDSDNGITITADAIMGDKYNAVIVYTLSRDDGERFLPEGVTPEQLMVGGFSGMDWIQGGSHGTAGFTTGLGQDGASASSVQYVEKVSTDRPMTGGTATAEFENLSYSDANGDIQRLYDGHWKFRFDVDFEDCGVYLGSGETVSQDGLTFTINQVMVSPIAVQTAYTADLAVVWDDNGGSGQQSREDARQAQRYLENIEILLTKTDGTVIDLSNSGGSITPDYEANVSRCTKGEVLDEIIPLEELESVSVAGVVYEIPQD